MMSYQTMVGDILAGFLILRFKLVARPQNMKWLLACQVKGADAYDRSFGSGLRPVILPLPVFELQIHRTLFFFEV